MTHTFTQVGLDIEGRPMLYGLGDAEPTPLTWDDLYTLWRTADTTLRRHQGEDAPYRTEGGPASTPTVRDWQAEVASWSARPAGEVMQACVTRLMEGWPADAATAVQVLSEGFEALCRTAQDTGDMLRVVLARAEADGIRS